MGNYAFNGCTSLKKLILEDCVLSIGDNAFAQCSGLTEVKLPVDVDIFKYCRLSNGYSYRFAFNGCTNVTKIHYTPGQTGVMPDKTTTQGRTNYWTNSLEYACRENLTTVILDEGITHIGDYAFYVCTKLNTVVFRGNAPTFSTTAFSGCATNVYYPLDDTTWTEDVKQNYGGTLNWVAGFPEHVTLIPAAVATVSTLASPAPVVSSSPATKPASSATPIVPTTEVSITPPTLYAVYDGVYDSEPLDSMILHTASFSGLVPGEEYVMVAVRDLNAPNMLSSGNLLHLDQMTALDDGTLQFQYILPSDILEHFVFACGASSRNLNDAQITIPEVSVDDAAFVVDPVVVYDGKTLVEYVDYVVVEGNQVTEAGEYTCIIRGICNYTGLVRCVYQVAGSSDVIVSGDNLDEISYTVSGQTVTISYELPCRVGYIEEESQTYTAIPAVAIETGGYHFTAPKGITEVRIVIAGNANGDERFSVSDVAALNAHICNKQLLSADRMLAADVNGDSKLDESDIAVLTQALLGKSALIW